MSAKACILGLFICFLTACSSKQTSTLKPFKKEIKVKLKKPLKAKVKPPTLKKAFKNKCLNKKLSISVKAGTSYEGLLQDLATTCDFNIFIQDPLAKKKLEASATNLHINKMRLEEILNLILKEQNLGFDYSFKAIKIYGIYTKSFKLDYISSVREGQSIIRASVDAIPKQAEGQESLEVSDDNLIKTIEKFDFYKVLGKNLKAILNSGYNEYKASDPVIDQNAGLITITASKKQIDRIKTYLETLQQRLQKQVIIEVKIISVALNETHQSGVNWDSFALFMNSLQDNALPSQVGFQSNNTPNSPSVVRSIALNAGLDFAAVLNFLQKSGKTKVLSSPRVLALNNQQAIFSVGDTINYQTKESSKGTETGVTVTETYNNYSVFIGILLNILPAISENDDIILRISPSLSDFKYPQDKLRQKKPRVIAPDIVSKKLSTVVRLHNSQTLILGGLISSSLQNDSSKVKFLSLIPILGWFFMGERQSLGRSEVIFVIKPTVVTPELALKRLDYDKL